jgi:hypothetical protein
MVPRWNAFTYSCFLVVVFATISWVSGDCTYLAYDDTQETCLAIQGVITARFAGIDKDTSLEIDEYLQSVVKNVIEADDSGIPVMNIRNVIYTSDRIPPNSSNGQAIQSAARASGGGSGGTILLSTILSVSLLFLCVGSIFMMRRSRREEEVATMSARNLEVPSTSADLEEARSHDSSGSSADTAASVQGEDAPNAAKLEALRETSAMTLSISMSSSGEAAPYADTPDSAKDAAYIAATKTAESSGDQAQNLSSESVATPTVAPIEEKLTVVIPAELPPRPPALLPRTQSKKLKKRRKKKKKKKKAILQRVNSRENVAAMQAIPESEEDEESEIGSEYGDSEYSTDDDSSGLKSGPSSGCNTPVRSLSRANSRSNSPMLSAQDELFPSDVFADLDYTFDIEAPDLLAETAKMKLSDATNVHRASLSKKRSARKQKMEGGKEDVPNLPPVNSGLPPLPPLWV